MDCIFAAIFANRLPITVEFIGIDTEQGAELMLVVYMEDSESVEA